MANDVMSSRQNEAYEFYRSLPPEERTYVRVAEHFKVSPPTVNKWKNKGNWDERIKESVNRVTEEVERRIEKSEVQGALLYLKFVDSAVNQAIERLESGELKLTGQELIEFMRFGIDVSIGLGTVRAENAETDESDSSDKTIKRSFVGGDTDGEK